MSINENDLKEVLRQEFLHDDSEHIKAFDIAANDFLNAPEIALRDLMRVSHNLKGSAQLAGFIDFSALLHQAESVFSQMQKKSLPASEIQAISLMIRRLSHILSVLFETLSSHGAVPQPGLDIWKASLDSLTEMISSLNDSEGGASHPSETPESLPSKKEDDDWGLDSTPDTSFGDGKNRDTAATGPTTSEAKVGIDFSQGWGLFENEQTQNTDSHAIELHKDACSVESTVSAFSGGQPGPTEIANLDERNNKRTLAPVSERGKVIASDISPNTAQTKRQRSFKEVDTSTEPSVASDRYLLCANRNTVYALPVKYVLEIMPDRPSKPLPVNSSKIGGVISFRGQVMAVLNILDQDSAPNSNDKNRCIVVCQIGRKQFGFRVDLVSSVIDLQDQSLQSVSTNSRGSNRIVSHLAHIENMTVSIIDLKAAVAS